MPGVDPAGGQAGRLPAQERLHRLGRQRRGCHGPAQFHASAVGLPGSPRADRADGKPLGFPSTDALRYLSRHDIKAELHELEKSGSVEETLASAVSRLGGELLVMGAFGHSRLREFMFGGVSRYFLEQENGPALLMAH